MYSVRQVGFRKKNLRGLLRSFSFTNYAKYIHLITCNKDTKRYLVSYQNNYFSKKSLFFYIPELRKKKFHKN